METQIKIGDVVKLKSPYGSSFYAPFSNTNKLIVSEINEVNAGDKFLRNGKESLCRFNTIIFGIQTESGQTEYYNYEWIEKTIIQ